MSGPRDDDGVPVRVAAHAEWRGQGRRLYLDGEPFPYGTHAPPVLDPVIEEANSVDASAHGRGYHVLWVPVVVVGTVDTSAQATEPRHSSCSRRPPVSLGPPEWSDPR